jgi:transcriptional regulator GlxA family with amidase domain
MTRTVGIYVYEDVEVLDFAGPYEVFTCATRVSGRLWPGTPPPFQVRTIARQAGPLRARAGLAVLPEATIAAPPPLDVLVVAGGVVERELGQRGLLDWLAATAARCEVTASVCTGALLLAEAGLLDGKEATTHWEDMDALRRYPRVRVRADRRWVDEGAIVTSGGISAGMDMSLHLVARLAGHELAARTALQMEYDWRQA